MEDDCKYPAGNKDVLVLWFCVWFLILLAL